MEFRKPYKGLKLNKCSFSKVDYFNKPGNYIIKESDVVRYVGRSECCVYRAAYRHFAKWCKGRRVAKKYKDTFYSRHNSKITLCIILHENPVGNEIALIEHFKPTDNRQNKYIFRIAGKSITVEDYVADKQKANHPFDIELLQLWESEALLNDQI